MEILNIILVYYKLHNNNFKPIKSLEIVSSLNDVSSNPVTWEPTTIIF